MPVRPSLPWLAAALLSAAPALAEAAAPAAPAMHRVGASVLVASVAGLFLWCLRAVRRTLGAAPGWSLPEALSEWVENAPPAAGASAPGRLVASSSRLIALLGLAGILTLFLAHGLVGIWRTAMGGDVGQGWAEFGGYLGYGAVMFAPYAVNKAASALEGVMPKKGP